MSGRTGNHASSVAVIGMSGRFPGANDVRQLWRNLCEGIASITVFDRASLDPKDRRLMDDQSYINVGAVLDNIDRFDAALLSCSGAEAEVMDPQQRIFLQCAWEALEDSGYNWQEYPGLIGVFAGASHSKYFLNNLYPLHRRHRQSDPVAAMMLELANQNDYLSTRTSYKLGLTGPSVNVQTACSTSLVAVHLACQSLLSGDTDMALAGGISIKVPHRAGYLHKDSFVVSRDGRCYAFDERASGTVFGSGVGIVVLKLLEDAVEDGDNIYAVIRGSAINNDGATKAGFVAPSFRGQQKVIEAAIHAANIQSDSIGYVETHGTGTPLGDPVEVSGLTAAFKNTARSKGHDGRAKCAIASLKTNIGHLEEAAGVAGLIKAALALKHGKIPASLNFERPNPEIDFFNSPFFVNTELTDWKPADHPRRAGVSSFGIGGTNAHVILEEYSRQRSAGCDLRA
jgi:acyl transferase domain-containing protein